jgi:hypothetical protein
MNQVNELFCLLACFNIGFKYFNNLHNGSVRDQTYGHSTA